MIATNNGGRTKIVDVEFATPTQFVTVGVKHIKWWSLEGPHLESRNGIFGDTPVPSITCACFPTRDPAVVLTGTSEGHIFIWRNRTLAHVASAHAGRCDALALFPTTPNRMLSGGADGTVRMWEVSPAGDLKTLTALKTSARCIRSLRVSSDETRLVVGTKENELFEYPINRGDIVDRPRVVARGHVGEVWGVAPHPTRPNLFLSAGDDGVIALWDSVTRTQLASHAVGPARCVAISHDGGLVAAGLRDGKVTLLQLRLGSPTTFTPLRIAHHRHNELAVMRFSPDGHFLAVGSRSVGGSRRNEIDILSVPDLARVHAMPGHSASVTALDWDDSSTFVQSTCNGYEILFWDARSGHQITASHTMRDTRWSTISCKIGWGVQGIWPPCSDGSDINSVDVNRGRNLIVMGNDFRHVVLARYPCVKRESHKREFGGHSEHVTGVRFNSDDSMVASTGGLDASVMLWQLTHA